MSPSVKYYRELSWKNISWGNVLEVQCLRLSAFTAEGLYSIPGWETKIPQAAWCSQKNKKHYVVSVIVCDRHPADAVLSFSPLPPHHLLPSPFLFLSCLSCLALLCPVFHLDNHRGLYHWKKMYKTPPILPLLWVDRQDKPGGEKPEVVVWPGSFIRGRK